MTSWPATCRATGTTGRPRGPRRTPTAGGGRNSYEEIVARNKVILDLFWLRDESLEDSANLPEPHVLAQEIADDLRSALEQIERPVSGSIRAAETPVVTA